MSEASAPEVRDEGDHVEVAGLSADAVGRAVALYMAAVDLRDKETSHFRNRLHEAMLSTHFEVIPAASQAQAQRTSALREHLLSLGYVTNADLAQLRDAKESSVRTWVSRQRDQRRLFTVKLSGQAIIPSVQLDDAWQLREEVAALVTPLLEAGLDSWSLWAWLCSPTGRLSGEVPAEVATTEPDRAVAAARRYATQIAAASDPGAA